MMNYRWSTLRPGSHERSKRKQKNETKDKTKKVFERSKVSTSASRKSQIKEKTKVLLSRA